MKSANIAEIPLLAANETPDRAAIIEGTASQDRQCSFAELADAVMRTASLLQSLGMKRGDGILIWQPMSVTLYVLMIAAWCAGGVVVFIDPGQTRRHIAACGALWPIKVLAGPWRAHALSLLVPGFRTGIRRLVSSGWFPTATPLAKHENLSLLNAPLCCDEAAPALVTFTSGGTGQPKAIVRSHGFLVAQHRVLQREFALSPGERELTTMPIFLLANLGSSVTSIIPPGGAVRPGAVDPAAVVAQIRRLDPGRAVAAPAFWERLLAWPELPADALASFRRIFTGGGPVYPELLAKLRTAAPNAMVTAVYGSTEAEPIAHITAHELADEGEFATRLLPAGHPVPDIAVRVIRDQWGTSLLDLSEAAFADLVRPSGECGEIVVSGELVIPGYLHGRGDEETKFRVDGTVWHRTGDAGVFDNEGRLWLAGRVAAKAKVGGNAVYPFEAEILARRAGIARSALLVTGGRPVLAVESDDDAAIARLATALASRGWGEIAIRQLARLPMDRRHNSKIDYPQLKKMLNQ